MLNDMPEREGFEPPRDRPSENVFAEKLKSHIAADVSNADGTQPGRHLKEMFFDYERMADLADMSDEERGKQDLGDTASDLIREGWKREDFVKFAGMLKEAAAKRKE